jgi:hypothetical protein
VTKETHNAAQCAVGVLPGLWSSRSVAMPICDSYSKGLGLKSKTISYSNDVLFRFPFSVSVKIWL